MMTGSTAHEAPSTTADAHLTPPHPEPTRAQIREKDYGEDDDVQLPQRNQHFTTTKAEVDNITVSKAHDEGLYAHCVTGGKVMRTVSADSPAWFQVPDAAVAPLTPEQLRILLDWKAPLPRRLVELEDKEHEAPRAPPPTCPLRCTHAGCSLVRLLPPCVALSVPLQRAADGRRGG